MSDPYIGQISMFAGNFAPLGWALCDGSVRQISDDSALFQLIGTTYGGDGQTTFALPDLRGRAPVHQGGGRVLGEAGGSESVTLVLGDMGNHGHRVEGSVVPAPATSPTGNVPGTMAGVTTFAYGTDLPTTGLAASTVGPAGGNQPHDNMQPYQCINFIISLEGVYPPPN